MKNNNRIISGVLSFCLLFSLFMPIFSPIVSFAVEETIYIENAEEFIEFAKKCSYDAWSRDITVILKNNISLKGVDYAPIPSFSGTFDGDGHTISDINVQGAYAPSGLFATLEKNGVVKNLTVTGAIAPDGDRGLIGGIVGDNSGKIENCSFIGTVMGKNDVGGIAGINRLNGSITSCQTAGEIVGEARTGGIAGSNYGLISSSVSSAKVNTVSITPSLSLDEINFSLTLDITRLPSLNNLTMTDTGGICGYSTGIVVGCVNKGRVGYPHVGYNVGGIAGRSSGHLSGNVNNAEVYGRKDVGGIVGQMEPHIDYLLSPDILASLKSELDKLGVLVGGAVENTDGSISSVSGRLNNILTNLDKATDSLDNIISDAGDYGDDLIGEINRISDILTEVLSQLSDIGADVPELTELLGKGLDSLGKALEGLENVTTLGAYSIADLILVAQDASFAFDSISESIGKINEGTSALEGSLNANDKEAAEDALDTISEGLSSLLNASGKVSEAIGSVTDVLGNAVWAKDAIEQFAKIAKVFTDVSSAVSDIYDATVEIDENIDVYWSKLKEGGDELISAFDSFTCAMTDMNTALDLMDSGLGNIIEGLKGLYESVKVNDSEAVTEAVKRIADGFDQLVKASAKGSAVLSEFSDILKNLDISDPSDTLTKISESLDVLSGTGTEATEAIAKLFEGMSAILDNIEINFDSISESGGMIIGGVGNMTNALEKMRNAVRSMSEGMISLNNAINAVKESVVIKDEEAVSKAFDNAYSAIGKIVDSLEDMSEIITESAKTLEEARIWGDDLVESVSEVTDSFTLIIKALIKVQDGIESLKENISFDGDLATEGTALIREGLASIGDASTHIKNALTHLADSFTDLEGSVSGMGSVITDAVKAIMSFAECAEIITETTDKINTLLGYMNGVDGVQLPTPSGSIKENASQLFIYISTIENELKYLNGDMTSLSSDLVARIGKINEIFNEMSNNIVDMIYGIADGSIIDNNVTESEIDSVTYGKLFSCTNYGSVRGDINVGGISGAMGLEYSLDPEDDLSEELTVTQKKQYRMKAVIHASRNYGDVTSKYDGAGGICGKMDFGLIYGCETYCHVQSEAGNYVGGVAGITAGLISQCFVKSTLSGGKYVGGIVGSGVGKSHDGDSSMVRNNYAMVEILGFTQYAGAVAGANIGQYSENLFISDTLAGIDRVSYQGKAEPISYEDLIKRRSIPTGFYSFILKFVADGVVLKTVEFKYGDSLDSSVFPEIPKKNGYYGYWDRTALADLEFDTTVSVVYKPYVTTLGGEEKRDNGREIFFVRGEFTDDCKVTVTSGTDTAKLQLRNRFFTIDTLIESWVIEIPVDNLEINTVHYLPDSDTCRIYLKLDGIWQETTVKEFGSYLTFEVSGERIEIAIIKDAINPLPIVIIASLAFVAVVATIIIVTLKKKKSAQPDVNTNKEEIPA